MDKYQWIRHYINRDTKGNPNGGVTVCGTVSGIVDREDLVTITGTLSYAKCSKKDSYSRKLGREIATGRSDKKGKSEPFTIVAKKEVKDLPDVEFFVKYHVNQYLKDWAFKNFTFIGRKLHPYTKKERDCSVNIYEGAPQL